MQDANLVKKYDNELNKELNLIRNRFDKINILVFILILVIKCNFSYVGSHAMAQIYFLNMCLRTFIEVVMKYKYHDSSWKLQLKHFFTNLIIAFSLGWLLYMMLR